MIIFHCLIYSVLLIEQYRYKRLIKIGNAQVVNEIIPFFCLPAVGAGSLLLEFLYVQRSLLYFHGFRCAFYEVLEAAFMYSVGKTTI